MRNLPSEMDPEFLTQSAMKKLLWLLLLALCCSCALACGPDFPNMMLVGGDGPVLTAPVARFADELARMEKRLRISIPPFRVVTPTNAPSETTGEIDLSDLRAALQKRGDDAEKIQLLTNAHAVAREQLLDYGVALEKWKAARQRLDADTNAVPPNFPGVSVPEDLPGEFADYFRGAIAWHRGDTNAARAEWKHLLDRPAKERRYKSTWAAAMLGKSFEGEDSAKAITHYSFVRALAKDGFVDSLGLAASSLGWQARAHLRNNEVEQAIELYLEQLALEDYTACGSLRVAARQALKSPPAVLDALAKNPRTRAVITALIISTEQYCWEHEEDQRLRPARTWLEVVERADVSDVDSAEQLALANYQMGRFDLAERWLKRAPDSSVSQWLQAKLFLRRGKVDSAVNLLAKLTSVFPVIAPTNSENVLMAESLYLQTSSGYDRLTPGRQVLGELGVLRLHRREYVQALDALLRGGFWVDAAYVAERVLTADELKDYVDTSWPEVVKEKDRAENLEDKTRESTQSREIRYVLARRLARLNRSTEARAYYPQEWLEKYDLFLACLNSAFDTSAPRAQRITNYYTAAFLIRSNGMEMIGTEVQPDFTCWKGDFEEGPSFEERMTNAIKSVTGATHDELDRAKAHGVEPDERWHYRAYAWPLRAEGAKLRFTEKFDAIKLMPNNTDETAMALYKLGKEAPDLQMADMAYKALVRRCRKTELGDAADRQRWFPPFDANGKPIVTRKDKPAPAN